MIKARKRGLDGACIARWRNNFSACGGPIARPTLIFKSDAGVVLAAKKDGNRGDVKPDQGGDAGAERSVNKGIVGKPGDVPTESQRDNEPEHGGQGGSRYNPLPAVRVGGSEVVDDTQDAHTGDQGNCPAHGGPENQHVGAELMVGVVDHPKFNLMAEDDEECGAAHGDQATGDEKNGQYALMPESPGLAIQLVGPQEALHQRQHDAHCGNGADDDGGDEHLNRPLMLVLQVRLGEVHGVGGQDFVQHRTQLAAKGGASGRYGYDRSEDEERGEDAQDCRICSRLARPQNVMSKRLDHGFPKVGEESQHTSEE
jgi:hypothetical protein